MLPLMHSHTISHTKRSRHTHRSKHTYTCTHIPAHRRTHAPMTSLEIHKQAISTRPNVVENLKHTQWKLRTYARKKKKVPSQITKQWWVNTADRKLGAKQRMGFFWREFFLKLNACSGALYFNGIYNAWKVLHLNMTHSNTSWLMHK